MKLKLEIQRFNSTNQTTHYELSQYTANDKPTYLIDYNGDMAKIDTAIYGADARSLVNTGAIGDLTTLETTAKSDLVSAVNEIKSATDTNTSNISTNTSNIASLGDDVGDLINLTTTAKNNLVSAVNELKGVNDTQTTNISKNANDIQSLNDLIQKFNLTTFTTYGTSDITAEGANKSECNLTLATNSDGSIFKFYGNASFVKTGSATTGLVTLQTSLRPDNDITISGAGFRHSNNGSTLSRVMPMAGFTIKTNGQIQFRWSTFGSDNNCDVKFFACLYFLKDFGDIENNE